MLNWMLTFVMFVKRLSSIFAALLVSKGSSLDLLLFVSFNLLGSIILITVTLFSLVSPILASSGCKMYRTLLHA
jgi:hypothetical protein